MDGNIGQTTTEKFQPSPIKFSKNKTFASAEALSTTAKNRTLRRNLLADYDNLPPKQTLLDLPESYLAAMRALQMQLERIQIELKQSDLVVRTLTEQNMSLKEKLMQGQKEKLQCEVKTNEILRDYNTLSQMLGQSRLQSMILKKQVEQLKRQKQNVLEKVTEKVCKQRAINVLEQQQFTRRSQSQRKSRINVNSQLAINSNSRTPYLKEVVSRELPLPRISQLPLMTLNPNDTTKFVEESSQDIQHVKSSNISWKKQLTNQPSISSIYQHRYEPATQRISEQPNNANMSYIQLVKEIMRNEKLLVQMTHQLQCYQKKLIESNNQGNKGKSNKQQLLLKMDILRKDITTVKKQIEEGRRRQSLL